MRPESQVLPELYMNDKNQTTQSKGTRTLTQQMRQAFADWVTALPFIKKDTTRDPEREDLESESVGRAAPPRADSALAGRSPDNKGTNFGSGGNKFSR